MPIISIFPHHSTVIYNPNSAIIPSANHQCLPLMAHVIPSEPTSLLSKHTFIRSYQACVPCRKRKVKCDLGDPGNPSDPPCRRCRREHKECYFQDLRTKKSDPSGTLEGGRFVKKARTLKSSVSPGPPSSAPNTVFPRISPPTVAPGPSISSSDSTTADRILHKEVHNASEALNLLYEAAAESRAESESQLANSSPFDAQLNEKLKVNAMAWRDFWCVRAGWMTDVEARTYVDLFTLFYRR